ncbi:MAG: ribosome small subunit-dependent GTPase A [Bacteroidetes bacterium]|nr:ribosome small subunit-dependent GTPase A [Bacteroidota bacterium]MDA1122434.1 ribosome small subunit-dependent GTPase A [Bacteroidota bacterium]
MIATVIKSTGSWYEVRKDSGEVMQCRLKGKFKLDDKRITNPIAVGDKVVIAKEDKGDNTWVISEIKPRENYIVRKAIKKSEHAHILAANIDQAVLIATLAMPRTSLGFIDRFLVTAEAYRIPAVILWNKSDLLKPDHLSVIDELNEIYNHLGYNTSLISSLKTTDIDSVRSIFSGKTTLIAGHSGVGKTTFLNALIPALNQKTSAISSFANKGVHTTTFAEMFIMDNKSFVIDTPGIKELGLIEIEEDELSHYFPEMRALFGKCKFHNCTHHHEPKCAVIEAVQKGEIAESRYLSYLSMYEDEESHR